MTQKLVLDENVICNAILLKDKHGNHDETSSKFIFLIYKVCHKIVCDKFLWKRYKKRIKGRIKRGDITIIRRIREILSNPKKCIRKKKDAKPLPDPIERDFRSTFDKGNEEDLMIARVAAENNVYALITDDAPFHDWINNVLHSRYDFSGLTPAEALEYAGLKLLQKDKNA